MLIVEPLDAYLADFGVVCIAGPITFLGILDQPDELVELQHAGAHSREHELTYRTTAVVLVRNQAITVAGVAYTVREAPRQIDDGAFSRALLSRT